MVTIEEKAKRYDEALKYAMIYYKNGDEDMKMMMKTCFPVLVEKSEDERIRKALIEMVKMVDKNPIHQLFGYGDITYSDMIAWLEKQGEQNYKIIKGKNYFCVKTHNYAGVEWIKGTKYYASDDYTLVNQGCECYCPEYSKEEHNNLFEEVKYDGCVEKQGEQKPVDTPKFKVGDILVSDEEDRRHIYKVDAITNYDTYLLLDLEDGYTRNESVYTSDLAMYLWTIQDAKDGDVLVCESGWTCIFKTLVNDETFSSYCFMDNTKWFCETGSECHTLKEEFVKAYNGKIHPATKEQRDQLEKAMADAGYTFDFESKELKKIEQNSAWSEEDEYYRNIILYILNNECVGKTDKENAINWLKSLKAKYTWKPSDEQIKVCKKVYADILSAKGFDLGTVNSELNRLEEELKKLKS